MSVFVEVELLVELRVEVAVVSGVKLVIKSCFAFDSSRRLPQKYNPPRIIMAIIIIVPIIEPIDDLFCGSMFFGYSYCNYIAKKLNSKSKFLSISGLYYLLFKTKLIYSFL